MAKVFRLHEKGKDSSGWFDSAALTSQDLETIRTTGREVATSIPSPFAQIDLVKTAFQWVVENELEGETAYHRLVSDALDVAQLFYMYQKYADKVRIEEWKPSRLASLQNSSYDRHRSFANTLELYWKEDANVYNFNEGKEPFKFYLLINKYNNKVIGSTSPATLFMGAPDLREAASGLNITVGDDILFDDKYFSLPRREPSFVEYFYALIKQNRGDFSYYFKEVYKYAEKVLSNNPDLEKKVEPIEGFSYPFCPVLGNANAHCEVFGFQLGLQKEDGSTIEQESDFVITPEKTDFSGKLPLVLPDVAFTKTWTYTTKGVKWNDRIEVPHKNEAALAESVLPQQGGKYPWLSRDNFLTEKLIKLPYAIDGSLFETCGGDSYLLPLTKTFFNYFYTGKVAKKLTFTNLAGNGVRVSLKIPVRGGQIHFEKIYHAEDIVSDKSKTKVYLAILPFFKVKDMPLEYTIGIVDDRAEKERLSLECFGGDKKEIPLRSVYRSAQEMPTSTVYHKFKKKDTLELLRLRLGDYEGVLIPKMPEKVLQTRTVHYAVDFGTTNTHIEYRLGDNKPKPLSINGELWKSLEGYKLSPEVRYFDREFFPFAFGNQDDHVGFPLRTALAFNANMDFASKMHLFLHANNYMLYEKKMVPKHLQVKTNLKWSQYSDTGESNMVEAYIESILYLLYLKTLAEGIQPKSAHLIWLFPASMPSFDRGAVAKIWKDKYKAVFGEQKEADVPIHKMSESVAPVFYYKKRQVVGKTLSIDIGGGTSDYAFFDEDAEKSLPRLISSVRFAGDVLWGDGYAATGNIGRNGYALMFGSEAEEALSDGSEEKMILQQMYRERKRSEDFNSFLFSLKQHPDINFDYEDRIRRNGKLLLPILLFFGALGYYIGKLLKTEGKGVPKYIALSGMGSKAALIIDPSLNSLPGLFAFMLKRHGCEVETPIKTHIAENPKVITCKGALERMARGESVGNDTNILSKFWLGGMVDDSWGGVFDRMKREDVPTYADIQKEEARSSFINAVNDFYRAMDDYANDYSLRDLYGISLSDYRFFQTMRDRDVAGFLTEGIRFFGKKPEDKIENSLFFYPLRGVLHKLSYELATNG